MARFAARLKGPVGSQDHDTKGTTVGEQSLLSCSERSRTAIGYLPNGFAIYPIFGAEGEPAGDGTNTNANGQGAGGEGDGKPAEGGDGAGTDGTKDTPKTYTAEEFAALQRKVSLADKRAEAAEKKVTDAERKDMDAKTRAETERDEARKLAESTANQLQSARIQNKFLASNKYNWHDPETALALIDMSDVEIDDNGKVTGLDDAMKALADAKPFLLKPKDDPKDEGKGSGKGKSGNSPKNESGNGSGRQTDRDRLMDKYPGLRRQVRLPG